MEARVRLQQGLTALGIVVGPEQQAALLDYLDELLRWNRSINLTAIRERAEGVEKHLLDALTLVPLLHGKERLLDIGSGGGLPGIPLKIALPGLQLVSVEAVEKKALFQRHVLRRLGIEAVVEHARIESLAQREGYRGAFDLVTARAFASVAQVLESAAPLLRDGGRVIAMKGPEGEGEWLASRDAAATWRCVRLEKVTLPFGGGQRQLLVFEIKSDPKI